MKFIVLIFLLHATLGSSSEYYGTKSNQAILAYEAYIVTNSKFGNIESLKKNKGALKKVRAKIDSQIEYLIGHFRAESFLDTMGYHGVIRGDYDIEILKIETIKKRRRKIHYKFRGISNFHSDYFKDSDSIDIPVKLPKNPSTIYFKSKKGMRNRCTDETYDSEEDFFYFWDPEKEKCPLKDNNRHVIRTTGTLSKLENTKMTYPEYDQLYSKDELEISILVGHMDPVTSRSSLKEDIGSWTFNGILKGLENSGFKRRKNEKKIRGFNRKVVLTKVISTEFNPKQLVVVTITQNNSSIDAEDTTFHENLKYAYEQSDIVVYDGHSGLGANLDLELFPEITLPNKYQIFFINGCSSYPYYNKSYFDAKESGSKSLEVITSGRSTYSSTSVDNAMAVLEPFINGELTSYQELMNSLEDSNGRDVRSYLMGVNGDEDNTFNLD